MKLNMRSSTDRGSWKEDLWSLHAALRHSLFLFESVLSHGSVCKDRSKLRKTTSHKELICLRSERRSTRSAAKGSSNVWSPQHNNWRASPKHGHRSNTHLDKQFRVNLNKHRCFTHVPSLPKQTCMLSKVCTHFATSENHRHKDKFDHIFARCVK